MSRQNKSKKLSNRIAVYPGSFDPITVGHIDIIRRISSLYEKVIVLVAHSDDKKSLFTAEERVELAKKILKKFKNVVIDSHQGLTVDYVRNCGSKVIVRGLRAVVDFEYEASMGNINKSLAPEIETVLVFSAPEYYFISSRMVKDVARNKGKIHGLVPEAVEKALTRKLLKGRI
jgi:pantetheine-phosphate adenylyltransferase